jgi:formylglycine-generating enzyme required for sulfatase activity
MGSSDDEPARDGDEARHWVNISKPFLLGVTEVTQGQWKKVMGNNPSYFSNCGDDCPVEQVSWEEVVDFCNRLSDLEGLSRCYSGKGSATQWDRLCAGYRLPTEAEWEYAARAGSQTTLHTGPLTIRGERNGPELDPIAWYGGNSGVSYLGGVDCSGWQDKQYPSTNCGTHPVARKQGNGWGLYDMLGNVWEWTWDWNDTYPTVPVTDPTGPNEGSYRAYRGGSWFNFARHCRTAHRLDGIPDRPYNDLGFRLARSLP